MTKSTITEVSINRVRVFVFGEVGRSGGGSRGEGVCLDSSAYGCIVSNGCLMMI